MDVSHRHNVVRGTLSDAHLDSLLMAGELGGLRVAELSTSCCCCFMLVNSNGIQPDIDSTFYMNTIVRRIIPSGYVKIAIENGHL